MSDPLSPSPLIHIGNTIQVISNFTALTAGVLGNVLVILVMTRPSMRTNSASFYFTILAFSDLGVVLSATPSDLLGWNRFGTGNSYSVFTCILTLYVIRVCGGTSLWLLVALGIDRLVVVHFESVGIPTVKSRNPSCLNNGNLYIEKTSSFSIETKPRYHVMPCVCTIA